MKHQPTPGFESNDDVQTPPALAKALVQHFTPQARFAAGVFRQARLLDPCAGDGAFYKAMMEEPAIEPYWCEIKKERDFFRWDEHVDMIITNPPFGQAKAFMQKAMEVSDHVVFLITLNHALGLKARLRMVDQVGFRVAEVVLLDTPPPPWPQAGFQLGAVHWARMKRKWVPWRNSRQRWLVTDWRGREWA